MQLQSATSSPSAAIPRHPADPPEGVSDPIYQRLIAVFNCSPLQQSLPVPQLLNGNGNGTSLLKLHPLQSAFEFDERTSSGCRVEQHEDGSYVLVIAARTTAVFVQPYSD